MYLPRHSTGQRSAMRSDFRRGQERSFDRAMALEQMRQDAMTGRTKLQEAGSLSRQELSNVGRMDLAKLQQTEAARQFGLGQGLEREKFGQEKLQQQRLYDLGREGQLFRQYKGLQSLTPELMRGEQDYAAGFERYKTSILDPEGFALDESIRQKVTDATAAGIPQTQIDFTPTELSRLGGTQTPQRYDTITRASGEVEYYDPQGMRVTPEAQTREQTLTPPEIPTRTLAEIPATVQPIIPEQETFDDMRFPRNLPQTKMQSWYTEKYRPRKRLGYLGELAAERYKDDYRVSPRTIARQSTLRDIQY